MVGSRSDKEGSIKKTGLYYGWIMLAACFVIGITVWGTRFSFGVFFNALQDDFGWTRAMTSGIFSVYMTLCAAVPILNGWLSDKYGPKLVICLAGFFTGLSLFLTSRATVLWQFYLTYSLLLALGTGGVYVVMMSTISRWFTTKRGLVIGIAGAGGGVGTLIMTPVAAQLISSYGWQTSAMIMGITAWVFIISGGLLLRRAPAEVSNETKTLPAKANETAKKVQSSRTHPGTSFRSSIRTSDFWLVWLSWFLYAVCSYLVTTHVVPFGRDSGMSALSAATLLSLVGGISVIGRVMMGRAGDTMGLKRTLLIGAFVQMAAMLLLAYAAAIWMLFLAAVVYGFVRGGVDACLGAFVPERFGLLNIGAIMGGLSIGYDFGATLGPILGGFIFDATNSYKVAFLIAGAASLVMAAAIGLLETRQPKSQRS
ncbi:MAG: MFS transporter [Chloroflexota bacterium]